ncbi:hydroxypyruvate reductase [Ectothiorhodosinus mongolicus]|uniref:Hydroxypyruvate reductase n=1 Tax=Ectothiorhodosinus mongolicus TaxID=233100 RepID=A0A1R3W8K8_9GAMM|nr:DUF4147 domain-containing protein [Ectothiorhodosinus mongolicus]ULX57497.1 hydroxypyruvate reductase [Ectothiorhodosinus mongolicus]SIT72489.1 hydroxypyruvate reductase [Ectothiorhodosinus mongolicus]
MPDKASPQGPRAQLLACFAAALKAVHGQSLVHEALQGADSPGHVVAIGKAAAAMARGAQELLGSRLSRGLLMTREGYGDERLGATARFVCLDSDHPVPGARSLEAGEALLRFIAETPVDEPLLFLISGGASSLVEVLADGVSLRELQNLNQSLLAGGLDIAAMNAQRKAISRIKGGGLNHYLGERRARVLLLSDVPGDDPAVIGSGLLAASARVQLQIVGNNLSAQQAAAAAGQAQGLSVHVHPQALAGDAVLQAKAIVEEMKIAPAGLHIWGGETHVCLPQHPGLGGRNQHLALAAAIALQGDASITLLAAGTDGSDGNTSVAGGMVDAGTLERGMELGGDAQKALAAADSYRFLRASGDLVDTGPTGTNVMDVVLALKG